MAMSAIERLRKPQEARILKELPDRVKHWGPPGSSMVIPTASEVDRLMAEIPKGRIATNASLCRALALRHGTTIACPVTTGILVGIAARAAAEMEMMGARRVSPWWRVVRTDGSLNDRMPGGLAEHARRLRAEGFIIARKGRNGLVVDSYENRLARLD